MTKGSDSVSPVTQRRSVKYEGGHRDGAEFIAGGLTKREYFAAVAMQGILSNPGLVQGLNTTSKQHDFSIPKTVALMAIEHVDALIDALNQDNK